MSKNKYNSYLKIPEDFKGFNYQEVKIRRAMLEMKKDLLMMKIGEHRAILRSSSPVHSFAHSRVGRFLGLDKRVDKSKGTSRKRSRLNFMKYISLGLTAYGLYRNFKAHK